MFDSVTNFDRWRGAITHRFGLVDLMQMNCDQLVVVFCIHYFLQSSWDSDRWGTELYNWWFVDLMNYTYIVLCCWSERKWLSFHLVVEIVKSCFFKKKKNLCNWKKKVVWNNGQWNRNGLWFLKVYCFVAVYMLIHMFCGPFEYGNQHGR